MDNELLLFDRLEVIRMTIAKYGEDNFYLSYSGGKDSTVVHHLLDMALPNNRIPRVYGNTGIEYNDVVDFVKQQAEKDDRFVIIKPSMPIKPTLEKYGYPFKSKQYSHVIKCYQRHKEIIKPYFEMIRNNKELLDDYEFIHNLPKNAKFVTKFYFGRRERERESCTTTLTVPNVLKYQFEDDFKLKLSDLCCEMMKERPLQKWQKENGKTAVITGLMREEGGRRVTTKCVAFVGKYIHFSPLAVMSKEWEEWFIKKHNIELCKLYYEPYNFERTGCKGCPFAINLQEHLETLDKYLPNERKQCEIIWKPVYDEYRRIGYRLKKDEQMKLF